MFARIAATVRINTIIITTTGIANSVTIANRSSTTIILVLEFKQLLELLQLVHLQCH